MARRMTPGTLRNAMKMAMTDDLFNGQPELQYRDASRQTPEGGVKKMYEVQGFIDPDRLGTFGAQQLEGVIERTRPGLMQQLNEQRHEITEADIVNAMRSAATDAHSPPTELAIASAVLKLITQRTAYRPSFDDL